MSSEIVSSREGRGRSKSRLLKIECQGCGMILRGSATALSVGMPTCACGGVFDVPELASLAKVNPALFEERRVMLGMGAHNALMRDLGYVDAVIVRKCDDPLYRRQARRCKTDGCNRAHVKGSNYCRVHASEDLPF